MPYRYRYRSRYRSKSIGHEAALRHIKEAEKLSEELGGTDEIVKQFLFGLRGKQLLSLLDDYQKVYGYEKRQYAEKTIQEWSSGRVRMSGLVAGRIYNLLPPQMPIDLKYRIAEQLWDHVGPKSQKSLRFGSSSTSTQVMSQVETYISSVVQNYDIPDRLNERFDWLTAGDVKLKQQILNHLRMSYKKLAVDAAREPVNLMFSQFLQNDKSNIAKFNHTIRVKNIELNLIPDPNADGVTFEEYTPKIYRSNESSGTSEFDKFCPWIIGIGIIIIIAVINW